MSVQKTQKYSVPYKCMYSVCSSNMKVKIGLIQLVELHLLCFLPIPPTLCICPNTVISRFPGPIAHCALQNHPHDYKIGIMRETLPFQFIYHVSHCSLQRALGARNHETTVQPGRPLQSLIIHLCSL